MESRLVAGRLLSESVAADKIRSHPAEFRSRPVPRRASEVADSSSPSSCRRRRAVGQTTCQRRFPQIARRSPTGGSGAAPSRSAPPGPCHSAISGARFASK